MSLKMTIDDATYHYDLVGVGETIVLLHGFTGSMKTWEPFIDAWRTDFSILTIDLPGHGETTIPSGRTMEEFANDLKVMLERLKIESCHLLGYSLGGRTALSFAMYYPEMVQSIILESASPGLRTMKERFIRRTNDAALASRIEKEGVAEFVSFWEAIPLFETQKHLPEAVQKTIRQERIKQTKAGLAMSLRFMGTGRQPSWWEVLHTIYLPVHLIVGTLDEKFVRMNKQMEKLLPKATLTEINKAGHTVHVEQPEKFAKLVIEQLKNRNNNWY